MSLIIESISQPKRHAATPFSSQQLKIPIEPGRMQAIKEAFERYKNNPNENFALGVFRLSVAVELDATAVTALMHQFKTPAMKNGVDTISWLLDNKIIQPEAGALATFIETHFKEIEPEETIQPNEEDITTKAERRAAIAAAYREYVEAVQANTEISISAFHTLVNKVNEQITSQEIKSIALAHRADASISNFKQFIQWMEGQPDLSLSQPLLVKNNPATVIKLMDSLFPKIKL